MNHHPLLSFCTIAEMSSVLDLFLDPVRAWFANSLGEPTPAQRLGWPAIAAGQHTLILAPTGSGKTLAAFLACLDSLWRQSDLKPGVQVLYVSPLKALNNDIERNLRAPLNGVVAAAGAAPLQINLPDIKVAVRTGDTPQAERQRVAKQPPHVLITTPESLHLLLTSNQREMLRGVRYCIIDEIHVLCPNKRGVFLSLLLERLAEINDRKEFVRIGLSATQRPLEEVAKYLGGVGRDVTVIDAGQRKQLDLQVVCPVEQFGWQPERSVWPSIHRLLLEQIRQHRSTIIFANNRRQVERIANDLNELLAEAPATAEETQQAEPLLVRPHHGSLSLEVRRQTEQALKEGRLAAVVATASLELGIDMGHVDLVTQVESPGQIARGLQRVGRAGHLVGQTSKGRLIPKTTADLLDQTVLTREMLKGNVETLHVPTNCLDVLAQQVVAMVGVDSWDVPELYGVIRRAYPYRDLTPAAFDSVLEMLSGRFPPEAFRDLKARISWDRVHNRLHALPGSRSLALTSGGTIPDTGQFAAYVQGTELRIGELDEEFVYERRIGDVFQLGVHSWRIEQIESDRVFVSRADGAPAVMPFWRGESIGRSADFGVALGQFLREATEELKAKSAQDVQAWFRQTCMLDEACARNLYFYLKRQIEAAGCLPTDQNILVEAFRDQLGDWHIAILSPLGSRFHLALRLAIEARWRKRHGYQPQCIHGDDGLLIKLVDMDEPPLDLLDDLDPESIEDLVLGELADSALFAIRFRHNAARTLMMPRAQPGKRAPLWLQRLRARSLLQICRQHPSFPVVIETYRECLRDHLDVDRLKNWLASYRQGSVHVTKRQADSPSPFAAGLLFRFTFLYMYIYDRVDTPQAPTQLDRGLLDQLVSPASFEHLLDVRAIHQVERRLRGTGKPPRSKEEMAEWLRRLGDVRPSDLEPSWLPYLNELKSEGRVCQVRLPEVAEPEAYILTEEKANYEASFRAVPIDAESGEVGSLESEARQTREQILRRFLLTHALVGLEDILQRYPFDRAWAEGILKQWASSGMAVRLELGDEAAPLQWSAPANWEEVQRTSLALARRDVPTVSAARFQDFVLRWQFVHPAARPVGPEGLRTVLDRLASLPVPQELWEQIILPSRVKDYQAKWLDELTLGGERVWALHRPPEAAVALLALIPREELYCFQRPGQEPNLEGSDVAVYEALRTGGAAFAVDIAAKVGRSPSEIKTALWQLAHAGLATNDRFDMLRRGDWEPAEQPPTHLNGTRPSRFAPKGGRRVRNQRPEGRWSLIPWGSPEAEERALHAAGVLLQRYGVVCRELAHLDPWLPPWRLLYDVLSRLELAGEVRRGYFVEGLSGAQFALPEAVRALAETPAECNECVLLHSQDPANLVVRTGALEKAASAECGDEAAPLPRRAGNWLVLARGKPVLFIEQFGKKLTPAPGANPADVAVATMKLGDLLKTGLGTNLRGKLSVEIWNGAPIFGSGGEPILEAAGFVRDYQALSLYVAYR